MVLARSTTWLFIALAVLALSADRAEAAVSCGDLAAAPRAPDGDANAARVLAVWQDVRQVAQGLTGLGAELRVIAPGARARGEPMPPNAVTCVEGGAVVVYVTDTLVDLVLVRARYPIDFLAFVLGHELGHRVNDLDASGRPLKAPRGATQAGAAFTGGGLPADREILADLRGAYFAAAAGYSVRRLACDDCLNDYLRAEARLAPDTRLARKDALRGVLADFEAWETVYETAVALSFWGFGDEAKRLLVWAEGETRRLAVPIPELDVLHALVLTMNAAATAPWLAQTRLPSDAVAHLRCAPIYPAHSALSEDVAPGAEGARGASSKDDLLKARRLLKDAEELGAGGLVIATGQACVSAYLGQTKEARRDLAKAQKLLPADAPPALALALAHDAAFIELVEATRGPAIAEGDAAGWKAYLDALAADKKTLDQSPAIAAFVKSLAKTAPGRAPPAPAGEAAAASCPAVSARAGLRLPEPPRALERGGCPCGWVTAGELRGESASPDAAAIVTTCVPAGWGVGQRFVDLRLPASAGAPPLSLPLVILDAVPAELGALGTWQRACDNLEARGTSDRGETMYAAQCPALGLPNGLLVTRDACRVERAVILDLHE